MGLDSVELVMACEEEFGVSLTDAEVGDVRTPRQLIDLICRKLGAGDTRECAEQRLFHVLRRGLVAAFGMSRREVRLDTDLRALVDDASTPGKWRALRRAVNAPRWPELERPRWLVCGLWGLSLAVAAGLLYWNYFGTPTGSWVVDVMLRTDFSAIFCSGLVAWCGFRWTEGWCTRIPADHATPRSLLYHVRLEPAGSPTRMEVACKVKAITLEQLGIKEEMYWEDANFVRDFGVS